MKSSISRYLCLLLLLPTVAFAEDGKSSGLQEHKNFFNLLYQGRSDLKVGYLYQAKTEADSGPGEFDLNRFHVGGEVPVALNQDLYLRFGGDFQPSLYDLESVDAAPTAESSLTLYKISFTAGAGIFLNDDLLITGTVRPGLYSDFEDSTDESDLKVYGGGVVVYQLNPGAQILGGVEYSKTYNDNPVLPLAGLRLQNEDGRLNISITAPVELRVSYNLDPNFQLYTGAWASGEQYRINAGPANTEFNVLVQDRRFGLGAIYWLDNSVNIDVQAGVTAASEFEFKTPLAGQFDGDVDPSAYIGVQLGFVL